MCLPVERQNLKIDKNTKHYNRRRTDVSLVYANVGVRFIEPERKITIRPLNNETLQKDVIGNENKMVRAFFVFN